LSLIWENLLKRKEPKIQNRVRRRKKNCVISELERDMEH